MLTLRELFEFVKLEIKERLFPIEKKRNELLLRAVHVAEALTAANILTIRNIAFELNRMGHAEEGFYGISELANHPQLAPRSELGQSVMALILEYAPNLKTQSPELYFENTLAACVNVVPGSALEDTAARLIEDAFGQFVQLQGPRAIQRLEGAVALVEHGSTLEVVMRGLLISAGTHNTIDLVKTRSRPPDHDPS